MRGAEEQFHLVLVGPVVTVPGVACATARHFLATSSLDRACMGTNTHAAELLVDEILSLNVT